MLGYFPVSIREWIIKHERNIFLNHQVTYESNTRKRFNNIHIITDKDQIDWIHSFVLLQEIISPKNVSLNSFVILPSLWGKICSKEVLYSTTYVHTFTQTQVFTSFIQRRCWYCIFLMQSTYKYIKNHIFNGSAHMVRRNSR